MFSLWWYFAFCWLGYHLLCLSGVEVDFGRGGHHEKLAVDTEGIIAAVREAVALFLGEIVTVMQNAISFVTAVLTSAKSAVVS